MTLLCIRSFVPLSLTLALTLGHLLEHMYDFRCRYHHRCEFSHRLLYRIAFILPKSIILLTPSLCSPPSCVLCLVSLCISILSSAIVHTHSHCSGFSLLLFGLFFLFGLSWYGNMDRST